MSENTRERWLELLVDELRTLFWREASVDLPEKLRVSCGWPATGGLGQTIGQCWYPAAAADGYHNIFISPRLSNPIAVGTTLVHELCHTVAGPEAQHGKAFKRLAVRVGLTGKMTATVASPQLAERLQLITSDLEPYPHGAINAATRIGKKEGTRLRKVECPACGYTLRTTAKWLEIGLPTCPCGAAMIAVS